MAKVVLETRLHTKRLKIVFLATTDPKTHYKKYINFKR